MHALHFLAPLFFAVTTSAQAVEEGIAPSSPPPSGCELNADGNFTIGTLKVGHRAAKRESGQEAADSALVCTLEDGVLRDRDGRTGSVVANHQFQFDGPPQAGAIYTGGFSICANGSLAIGGTTQWWQCSSGGFYNLYDEWIGSQCEEIRIQITFPEKPTPSPSSSAAVSSSTVPVASIASSLITITGAVSTVSASAVGPSASFASQSGNATMPSSASLGMSTPASSTTRGPVSGSSSSVGATGAADAPSAGAAPASFDMARGTICGAVMAFIGVALIL